MVSEQTIRILSAVMLMLNRLCSGGSSNVETDNDQNSMRDRTEEIRGTFTNDGTGLEEQDEALQKGKKVPGSFLTADEYVNGVRAPSTAPSDAPTAASATDTKTTSGSSSAIEMRGP